MKFNISHKILDPQNTHEKNIKSTTCPQERNFGPPKTPTRKSLDSRHTFEKKFWTYEIHKKKFFPPAKIRWYGGMRRRTPTIRPDF